MKSYGSIKSCLSFSGLISLGVITIFLFFFFFFSPSLSPSSRQGKRPPLFGIDFIGFRSTCSYPNDYGPHAPAKKEAHLIPVPKPKIPDQPSPDAPRLGSVKPMVVTSFFSVIPPFSSWPNPFSFLTPYPSYFGSLDHMTSICPDSRHFERYTELKVNGGFLVVFLPSPVALSPMGLITCSSSL